SALALFLLSTATILPLVPLPKVEAATTSNLAIKIYNVDGSPAYSLGGTTNVRLYDSTYTSFIRSATIDSNSQVSWSNLNSGDYYIEVYHSPPPSVDPPGNLRTSELWGTNQVSVPSGGTGNYPFTRHAPYVLSMGYSSTNITLGQSVTYSVSVKNPDGSSRVSKVRLVIDRDQLEPFDCCDQFSSQVTIPAGGTYTFTFNFTPSQAGSYFRYIQTYTTYTLSNGIVSNRVTDQDPWENNGPG